MYKTLRSLSIAVLFCLGHYALAQTESGTISGRVVDSSGSAIPNAAVKLTNQATGVDRNVTTETSGDFVFTPVLPGVYTVSVAAPGFKAFQEKGVTLTASERLSIGSLMLSVGALTESVTVTAEITPVQNTSAERSGLVSGAQTAQLLTVGRDITSLVRILPGVVGGGGADSLGSLGLPTINGVRSEYNTATVDGVIGTTRGYNNLDTPPNLDAIAEVKVLQSNYQAEYGKAMGSSVNIVTKSGTQQFHGTAYYYIRNEAFNANNYFNNLNGLPRPRYRYNTIGGNFGGPVFWPGKFNSNKNKLFAFFSQEYLPIKSPDGIKFYTVPTAVQRKGDFSQTFDTNNKLIVIKDPTNGGAPFTGNMIQSSRISTAAQALLNIFPQPNFTNTAISGGNYNYITNNFANQPTSQSILRLDYNFTEKWRMFFRGLNMVVNNDGFSSPANADPWLAPANYKTHNPNVAINLVWAATPTLVNELTLGTAFWTEDQILTADSLKLLQKSNDGISLGQLYPQFNPLGLIPQMNFGGVPNAAGGGPNGRFPLEDVVSNYDLTDGLTKIWNKHTFKFGADVEFDTYLQKHTGGSFAGNFVFDKNTSNPFDTNYAYSNALLGYFSSYSEINNRPDYKPHTRVFEWYAQDQWRVTKRLTLDLGVRFTLGLPQTLQNGSNFIPSLYSRAQSPVLFVPAKVGGQNVAVNPLTNQTFPAVYAGLFVPGTGNLSNGSISVGTPGYPSGLTYGTGVTPAPRIGFAWDPFGDGKTAIRGGFGIFLNARARTGQAGDMVSNPPNIFTLTEYYGNVSTFLNAGTLLGPPSVGHANQLHPNIPSTYNMSLGIQRRIGFGTVVDVAYVGTLGRHLTDYIAINTVAPGAHFLPSSQSPIGGVLPDNFLRPYPGYGSINLETYGLTSSYHSLQAQINRRFARGLQFGAAFTYSKALDYTDSYNGTIATYINPRVYNYGEAGFNRKFNLTFNYLWDIPRASKLWNSPITRWGLDNWQISGITQFVSGAPCAFGLSGSTACGTSQPGSTFTTVDGTDITGGGDAARVILTCNPNVGGQRSFSQWFNTGCVHRPAQGTFGNASASPFVGPGVNNWNIALFKNVPIKEKITFQLRVETYNTFNHTQFTSINTTPRFDINGNQVNSSFGKVGGAADPRYMQFAVRLSF
jgi:outer membrane receptor protein involved in Fe transport